MHCKTRCYPILVIAKKENNKQKPHLECRIISSFGEGLGGKTPQPHFYQSMLDISQLPNVSASKNCRVQKDVNSRFYTKEFMANLGPNKRHWFLCHSNRILLRKRAERTTLSVKTMYEDNCFYPNDLMFSKWYCCVIFIYRLILYAVFTNLLRKIYWLLPLKRLEQWREHVKAKLFRFLLNR